jgi:3'-5' exoribonuclease
MPRLVLIRDWAVRKTRNQDSFAALRINLGSAGDFAEVEAKIWGLDGLIAKGLTLPATGDLIDVLDHKEDVYQGRPQWIVREFRRLSPEERARAMNDFIPPVRIDAAAYRKRLDDLIEQTDPRHVGGIALREFFDDAGFREEFCAAPAAVRHHQSYPGGLLEHTINVTTIALVVADAYGVAPEASRGPLDGLSHNSRPLPIDRHVLIAAGLLHDIGKIQTYRLSPLSEITDQHNWEGHLSISYALVRARIEPLLADPPYPGAVDELHKLLHCILSHHGKLEFGSPVMPACAEAFILSQADMIDARLAEIAETAASTRTQDGEARWLARNLHFPGGVFIGDWDALEDGGERPPER